MDSREPAQLAPNEPTGMIVGSNSYGSNLPNTSMMTTHSAGMIQAMRLPFGAALSSVSKPNDTSNSPYQGDASSAMRSCVGFSMSEPVKKKRGRPRKYGPDGNMALALTPLSAVSGSGGYSNTSEPLVKRNRGRPPGSGKKQQLDALGSAGLAFTPHIITVKAGEDVASKIMAFSQQGSRTVCILSANGAICNVTLRQPATSGGTVTYEGRFEIISLSGSFLLTESGGTRSRTGGLSVSLAGSDGRVLGGGVAGMLMAASPVQVVVGSFISDGKKSKPESGNRESPFAGIQMAGMGPVAATSPPSQGTSSESSEPGSPINQSTGACNDNNNNQSIQHLSGYPTMSWVSPLATNQHRHDGDTKILPK
ncbi:AT-hook motif nuclear-localized protein 10-like [Aristolochia californica]|uniref:AT-hook motif nuclear-localized protein 10-like n=1 Tax=Aristolochia californica TaxID=171875 RepID=UPI0035DAEE71